MSTQDPLFEELKRVSLQLIETTRAEEEAEREALRPYFEAVLVGISLVALAVFLLVVGL